MIEAKQLDFINECTQKIINGDCLVEISKMEDNSVSAIVTDPPYGLKFMNKEWDHGIPGIPFWKEALRIAKPGTWLLAFGGTRTYHRLTCAIEDAGWEIKDSIMWIYGSGWPKGIGCLKPAYEPIVLARKKAPNPLLNIDECRIPTGEKWVRDDTNKNVSRNTYNQRKGCYKESNPLGRWPANVILDEKAAELLGNPSRFFYCAKASSREKNEGLQGMPLKASFDNLDGSMGGNMGSKSTPRENFHPTVKPLKLMEYLIRLVTPKHGILLDPFAGSGTTLLAAKRLGIESIGIELNPEYCEIARNRLL